MKKHFHIINENSTNLLLTNVSDAVSPQSTDGFIDGNTDPTLNDYEYDQNGNMILDRNKGITEIKYNHLNLPTRITWENNKYISYQYNALGQKVGKSVNHSDTIKTVNYLDGFQYAGNVLQFFPTAEGYVKATPTDRINSDYHFNYIYNYTDHLGNVRLSYTLDPQAGTLKIVDEHHYYPFGLRHEIHYPSSRNRDFRAAEGLNGGQVGEPVTLVNVTKTEYMYKYQGQERQDELGLNWDSFKWRNYDYAIARFFNVDPLSEQYHWQTHYAFSENRVIDGVELEGLERVSIHTRTFAPYNRFGGGFHGDGNNRKFTTSLSLSGNNSSRISAKMSIDLDKKSISSTAYGSFSDWLGQTGTRAVSNSYVTNVTASLGGDGSQTYTTHNYGANGAFLWGNPTTPDIDTKVSATFSNIDETGFNITGSVKGDKFPANETFIVDQSGNAIFLGISGADGNPYTSLFGDNNREMSDFSFRINMKDGKFTSVTLGDNTYTLEEWSNLFTQQNPKDGDVSTKAK